MILQRLLSFISIHYLYIQILTKGNNIWNLYSSRSLLLKQIEGHFYNRSKQELTLIHMMFSHQEMPGFCIDTLTMIFKM